MSLPKIELKKDFNTCAENVYDAWLDPVALKEFIKPADVVTLPDPKVDAKIGGRFEFNMHVPDAVISHQGEYKILDRASKIQFTWNSMNTENVDSLVTISIKKINESSCTLTLIHELLPSEESCKDHQKGWKNILDHLAKRLER